MLLRSSALLALLALLPSPFATAQTPGLPAYTETLTSADGPSSGSTFGRAVAVDAGAAVVGEPNRTLPPSGDLAGSATAFAHDGNGWQDATALPAQGLEALDRFGIAVAVSGSRVVVGAPGDDDAGSDAGAAYVFVRDAAGTWSQEAKLTMPAADAGDRAGEAVDIDGDRIVVGSSLRQVGGSAFAGTVYVSERQAGGWQNTATLTATAPAFNDGFGKAVSVSGPTIAVGASGRASGAIAEAGAVFMFTLSGGTWTQQAEITAPAPVQNAEFGRAVDVVGPRVLIGEPAALSNGFGKAYLFSFTGAWTLDATLSSANATLDDSFGFAVALDGDLALVGVPDGRAGGGTSGAGGAVLFDRSSGAWQEARVYIREPAPPAINDQFGAAVALSGGRLLISAPLVDPAPGQSNAGVVDAYDRSTGTAGAPGAPEAQAALSRPRPNPSADGTRLALVVGTPQAARVTLHDALGRTVAVLHDGPVTGATELSVDTSLLTPGVYVVRAYGGGFALSHPVVVAR